MFMKELVAVLALVLGATSGQEKVVPDNEDVQAATMERVLSPASLGEADLIWSDPPHGSVDLGQSVGSGGYPDGVVEIQVSFDRPVLLTDRDVEVYGTGEEMPEVAYVEGQGSDWLIGLDRPIPPGEVTQLVFGEGQVLAYRFTPGDFNGDGTTDELDLDVLIEAVEAGRDDLEFDFNRDGKVGWEDVDRLETAILDEALGVSWNGGGVTDEIRWICCCNGAQCIQVKVGTLCPGVPASSCPCQASSCLE